MRRFISWSPQIGCNASARRAILWSMTILYMRKRDSPSWMWIAGEPADRFPVLDELARGADQALTGPEEARRTLAFLEQTGFRDDGDGGQRTPVEVVDLDGQRVDL